MSEHVCDPDHPDCAAYLHYADPANREPAGPAMRRAAKERAEWDTTEVQFDDAMKQAEPVHVVIRREDTHEDSGRG